MIRTVTLLEAAFWRDPTYGYNAVVGTIPRAIIGGGTYAAPPALNIYTDAEDAGVAKTLVPPELPAIIGYGITRELDRSARNRPQNMKHSVIHAFSFVTAEDADEIDAQRNCELFLRAGLLVVDNYMRFGDEVGLRQINGIRVLDIPKILERRVTEVADKVKLWGWLEVHSTVTDGLA